MFGIAPAIIFVLLAGFFCVLGAFRVTMLGNAIGWYGLAAACLCGAWLAGGEVFH